MRSITTISVAVALALFLQTSVAVSNNSKNSIPNRSTFTSESAHSDHGEEEHSDHGEEEHSELVSLTNAQSKLSNIEVETLNARVMSYQVYSPGEIKANGYTSYLVSPRVNSVVIRRHVSLGDHVEEGQILVTLFSEEVAEAQASFQIAIAEWDRVKQLGKQAVGAKRYLLAQKGYEQSYSRLLAYGLSRMAVNELVTPLNKNNTVTLGEYSLVAERSGVVLSDDFHQGQSIEPGSKLIELAQEDSLWVEARLAPTADMALPIGTKANIRVGNGVYEASVVQAAHTIDPITRTRVVRLLVGNKKDKLHPGQFADVYFTFDTDHPVLAVPETALMRRSDGDWVVFVEVGERADKDLDKTFTSKVVNTGRYFGNWREITGLAPGSKVVMRGAFFVDSEIAKSNFDPHNH